MRPEHFLSVYVCQSQTTTKTTHCCYLLSWQALIHGPKIKLTGLEFVETQLLQHL